MSDTAQQIADALDNPMMAPAMAEAGDPGPDFERGKREIGPFPPACPIKPLGIQSGLDGSQKCYYLDRLGQIVGLEAGNRHGKNALIHMFGEDMWWLEQHFPQLSAPKTRTDRKTGEVIVIRESEIVGFDQAEASQAMIVECGRRGIFDPVGRLRGRGAHELTGGGLVLHYGDRLLAVRSKVKGGMAEPKWVETGLYERFVYPAAPALPVPWHEPTGIKASTDLIGLLKTWNWKRPLLDVRLCLGAIGQGFIGGALEWRSNVWITGDRGTGKSSLNGRAGVVPALYGDALFRTGQTSAAALRQSLRNSTVPVMIDELEPSADNRKVTEIIDLARISSSGDKVHRGGSDHQAHEFTLQSPFWFSSINIPPIEAADRSRLAILELKPFAAGTAKPNFAKYNFEDMGRKLHRRMIDAWPILGETKALFHDALSKQGHDNRGCDQFATLLACAHVLTDDEVPDEEDVLHWADLCAPYRMAEVNDAMSDQELCLRHLLTSIVQPRGKDERLALSTAIYTAVFAAMGPEDDRATVAHIEQLGFKLVNARWNAAADGKGGRWGAQQFEPNLAPGYLAVASSGRQLNEMFDKTKWQGGVYKQTLARVDGSIDGATTKIARTPTRVVMIPLYQLLDDSELPALSRREAHEAWRKDIEEGAAC